MTASISHPTLSRIRDAANVARARIELQPDLPSAADALEEIAKMASTDPTEDTERTSLMDPAVVLAARCDRLAELASEKLSVDPDADSILSALEDLAAIRRITGMVLR